MWQQVKKFGLGYHDVPTMIWNLTLLLRFLAFNIDSRYKIRIPTVFFISTAVSAVAYFYVYVVSIIWYLFWRCPESEDFVAAMVTMSLGICSAIGITKLVYFNIKNKEIVEIVVGSLRCDSAAVPHKRMYQNQLVVLRVVKKRALIVWLIIMVNWVIYAVKPFLLPGRHPMEEMTVLYGLEPMLETPNYEIAYIVNFIGSFFVCYVAATMTVLLIIITGCSEAQMLALSEELLNLWDDVQKNYESNKNQIASENKYIDDSIRQGLERIIKIHAMNSSQVHQVERVFRGAVAIEFTLLLCALITELLGGLENTYQLIPFAFIQVAMDCLAGQRVLDASITFEKAVYNCKWENFNPENMRTVLMMLTKSQRYMVLTAGGMADLTFACLMTVMRSVYSAYTTLRSTAAH